MFDSYNDAHLKGQVGTCEIWLSRSRSCPLSLSFQFGYTSRDVSQALAAVILHCARWEYLDLYLSPSQLLTIEGPMPLLRHLRLVLEEDPTVVVDAFRELPLLCTVILDTAVAADIVLPWAQLTSLTLHHVYLEQCVPMLQQTSTLVHCEMEIYFISGRD